MVHTCIPWDDYEAVSLALRYISTFHYSALYALADETLPELRILKYCVNIKLQLTKKGKCSIVIRVKKAPS